MLRCIFCGLCEEACPKDAIYLSAVSYTHLDVYKRQVNRDARIVSCVKMKVGNALRSVAVLKKPYALASYLALRKKNKI